MFDFSVHSRRDDNLRDGDGDSGASQGCGDSDDTRGQSIAQEGWAVVRKFGTVQELVRSGASNRDWGKEGIRLPWQVNVHLQVLAQNIPPNDS